MQRFLSTFLYCPSRQISRINRDQVCLLLSQLTQKGGELMMKSLAERPEYKTKLHSRDLLTETDIAVERLLIGGIRKHFPDHKIISEEGTEGSINSQDYGDDPTWIIDPIDGTMNFVHGFPHFCTSIGFYVEKKGEFGWIYNPMLKQNYVVQRGGGVYFNGQQMRVSGQRDLKKSLVYMEWSMRHNQNGHNVSSDNILKLLPIVHGIRSLGSAALNLAQVAIGACDAYVQFGAHIWDWAAGALMVKEAGGVVLDPCGGEFDIQSRRILATATPELAEQIIPLLNQVFPLPRDDESVTESEKNL